MKILNYTLIKEATPKQLSLLLELPTSFVLPLLQPQSCTNKEKREEEEGEEMYL